MQVKANLLGDVVVSAGRFEQKLSNVTVSMDLLKAEDITKQAPTDLSATLNTMPGVDTTTNSLLSVAVTAGPTASVHEALC